MRDPLRADRLIWSARRRLRLDEWLMIGHCCLGSMDVSPRQGGLIHGFDPEEFGM